MTKIKIFFLVLVFCQSQFAIGQSKLSFGAKKVDVGVVNESDSIVIFELPFTNEGLSPLNIKKVNSPCGCLSAEWPSESIAAKAKGMIKIKFQSYNRPGPFEKNISIHTNGSPSTVNLIIEGMVKPKSKGVEFDFPVKLGSVRLENKHFNIGNISNEAIVSKSFSVFNSGETSLFIVNKILPDNIEVEIDNKNIEPNTVGQLILKYNPSLKVDFGYRRDEMKIMFNDTNVYKTFMVYSNVMEYFSDTIDVASAPKLLLNKGAHDFGTLKRSSSDSTIFNLTNSGNNDLIIREVECDKEMMTFQLIDKVIKPSTTTQLKVNLLPSNTSGRKSSPIILYVNDPTAPRHSLKITARFEK